jgi:hypothetical protein
VAIQAQHAPGEPIPAALLEREVAGVRLAGRTLRDALGQGVTHVVFLRHFG